MIVIDVDVCAPFEVWEVLYGDQTIKFFEPLTLTPNKMPDDPDEPSDEEYLQVVCSELAINVYGETRDELLEAVHSNIRMNWKHVVCAKDSQLSAPMQTVKRQFLAIAELVDE